MSDEKITSVAAAPAVALKDLLIPLSILLAGIFIGAGLFFSGGSAVGPTVADAPLERQPEAPTGDPSKIDPITDADYVKGNRNAPIKIVEYSDFECPFCKRHHEVLQGIVDKLGGDQIAWVFRQFPLEALHPVKANDAAMGAECVGELAGNDAFWQYTDGYFENTLTNNRTDTETLIPKLAAEAGVNAAAFAECFESDRHQAAIDADILDATETGGRGTPWSIIVGPTGKTYPVNGAQSAAVIEQTIALALKEA